VGRQIAVAAAAAWLIILAALFINYQFGPFIIENRAPEYLGASAAVLLLLLACTAFGLKLLGVREVSLALCLHGLAVGLAVLAAAGFAALTLGILSPVTVYVLAAALLAVSYRQAAAVFSAVGRARMKPPGTLEAGFAAVMAVALAVGLINCLSPVTANDALVYHLNLPEIYSAEGGMVYLPFNVYANMPHYGEVIFALFYSVAGETGVALFYFSLLVAASLAVYALVARAAPRVFGMLAASAFLVQPLVLDHRVVANIDIMLAFIYLAAVGMVLHHHWRRSVLRSLILVSALAGLLMGIKYTGVAPALSLLALVLFLRRKSLPAGYLVLGIAVAAAVFMPWPIRQGLNTGSPFYPMLEGRFDGANWDGVQAGQLQSWQRSMGMGRGPGDYLALPFNVSVRGRPGLNYAHFDGTISPVFLILFPLAFIKRRRETMALALLAVALGLFWALTSQQLRFLLPALGLLAVLGPAGLAEAAGATGGADAGAGGSAGGLKGGRPWVVFMLLGVLSIEIVTLAAPNQYGRSWVGDAVGERLGATLGFEPRDRFLERTVQPFSLLKHTNTAIPPDEAVFMIWENRAYHLDRPYFSDSFFEASSLMRMVAGARDARELHERIVGAGYRYFIVNDLLGEVFARQYPREDIARLREFVDTYLESVHTANRVTLYRIRRR
jgi:hypothetical protein